MAFKRNGYTEERFLWQIQYKRKSEAFNSTIWACHRQEAEEIVEMRGIGEHVVAQVSTKDNIHRHKLPSFLLRKGKIHEALHAAAWLGMVGIPCGAISSSDLLEDRGLIHELSHLVQHYMHFVQQPKDAINFMNNERYMRQEIARQAVPLIELAQDLEWRVPGMTPERVMEFDGTHWDSDERETLSG